MRTSAPSLRSRLILTSAVLASSAAAQESTEISFSIDWHGVSKGVPSFNGPPLTEGDILLPANGEPGLANRVLDPPAIRFTGGFLGLNSYNLCVGTAPGTPCGIELDALSYGRDHPISSNPADAYRILFCVDEYVTGNGNAAFGGPSVSTEGNQIGEASSDVFSSIDLGPGPVGPQAGSNAAVIDGDGDFSATGARYPGVGVVEPNRPGQGLPGFNFDEGDNVDAFDMGKPAEAGIDPIYFSLDGTFLDAKAGVLNAGSAQDNGFAPGDVIARLPLVGLQLYAPAQALGLDQVAPGTDDLDALILSENGTPGYQISTQLYDWEAPLAAATDMLLFSVRRGSAIIGAIDSIQGLPIEEGDLLVPPILGGNGNPGIFIAAEALGLSTARSGGGNGDELNGGDSRGPEPWRDCNNNGIEDAKDIGNGTSRDDNMNGIPDECEPPGTVGCECLSGSPCNNDSLGGGCANSTGFGAFLLATGSSSWGADDLTMTTTGMPTGKFALTFMGPSIGAPVTMGAGLRCAGGTLYRYAALPTGPFGETTIGPGLVDYSCLHFAQAGCILIGSTWHFQTWYRDPAGPACATSNVSNSWSVTFSQ